MCVCISIFYITYKIYKSFCVVCEIKVSPTMFHVSYPELEKPYITPSGIRKHQGGTGKEFSGQKIGIFSPFPLISETG